MIYARGILRLLGIGAVAMTTAGLLLHLTHNPADWRGYAGLLVFGSWLAYRTRTAR